MARSLRRERAWLGLVLALLAWPLLRDAGFGPAACPHAVSRDGGEALTRSVRCVASPGPLVGPARVLFGLPIDLNRASSDTLQVLPGIGPGRAEAIVAERRARPFARVEELVRVHGIGRATLAKLAASLKVEAPGRDRAEEER